MWLYASSVSVLNTYMRCTRDFRLDGTAQLFVAYGRQFRGKAISMQKFSKWLVEFIKFAYDQNDFPTPDGVKSHQTCKMTVT